MKKHLVTLLLSIATCALLTSAQAQEQSQIFEQNDATQGFQLNQEKLTVAGNNNSLVILGNCTTLVVTGSGNTIKILAVDTIEVVGNNNQITWSAGASVDLPQIVNQGANNTIQSGEVTSDDMP